MESDPITVNGPQFHTKKSTKNLGNEADLIYAGNIVDDVTVIRIFSDSQSACSLQMSDTVECKNVDRRFVDHRVK